MDYYKPQELTELGIGDDEPAVKSTLEIIKSMSPPVKEHRIAEGDTLSELASYYGTTVREIVRLNPNIKNPNMIRAGETIDIPDGVRSMPSASAPSLIDRVPSFDQDTVEQDSSLETMLPMLKGIGALGALGGAGITKGIAGLAGAAPRAAVAGQIGQRFKGAVPHAGATPAMSNVRPPQGMNPGAVKAMLAKMQGQRPLGQGGQMPPSPQLPAFAGRGPAMPPGPNQALGQGARMPWMGKGTGTPPPGMQMPQGAPTPPVNNALLNALRQGGQKMNAGANEGIIQQMIQRSGGGQPTLGQLQMAGRGNLQGAGGNQSFQELLRRVGYGG
jgi:hypothetical protein